MVANLSAHKRGWDERWEGFSDSAVKGRQYVETLRGLIDDDTRAFSAILRAMGRPRKSEGEATERKKAVAQATKHAIEIPLRVMRTAVDSLLLIKAMAETGIPKSASDAGVAALCARMAAAGAYLNVKTNAADLEDRAYARKMLKEAAELDGEARELEADILGTVDGKLRR